MDGQTISEEVFALRGHASFEQVGIGGIVCHGQYSVVSHLPRQLDRVEVELSAVPAQCADVAGRDVVGAHCGRCLLFVDGPKVGVLSTHATPWADFVTNR